MSVSEFWGRIGRAVHRHLPQVRSRQPEARRRQSRQLRAECEELEPRVAPAGAITPLQTFEDTKGPAFGEYYNAPWLAISGGNLLIGAVLDSGGAGAAYLYNTSGQLLQVYSDPDGAAQDAFGSTLAVSGGSILIGAYGVANNTGAAYLYNEAGELLHTFQDPTPKDGDGFGANVALNGSDVLIGANHGKAYLYNLSGQLLHTFTTGSNSGVAITLTQGEVLIGTGSAAYLYSTAGELLRAFDAPTGGDFFGKAVALSADDVLIGAPGYYGANGKAYLYDIAGTLLHTFNTPTAVTAGYPAGLVTQIPYFGDSVALSGNHVAIGAYGDYNVADTTYLYSTSGKLLDTFADPNFVPQHSPPPIRIGAYAFGYSLEISGDKLLAGIDSNDRVYLYGIPESVMSIAGDNQSTSVGTAFKTELEVKVTDASGDPLVGYLATFTARPGGSGAAATFGTDKSLMVATNGEGLAVAPILAANHIAGNFTVTASVLGVSSHAVFALTNTPGQPEAVKPVRGNSQSAVVGRPFTNPPKAKAVDQFGNPLSGIPVIFSVISNSLTGAGGTFAGGETAVTETTNSNGIATAPILTANAKRGSFEVAASVEGIDKPATFDLSNTADPPPKLVPALQWWPPWVRW